MRAAAAVSRRDARRFERECERLRPLGEAYVLRHFGHRLGRADAEDAVAEVLIRLHRRAEEGRLPDNLRAMFFTSVRNAAIDLLRARAARPATVELEAAAATPDAAPALPERAESRERVGRLQEALARMRAGYRATILLRFGLGLTFPEIAAYFQISEAAAKKRVLRATAQVRKRMAAIEGEEFCPQMRELARGLAFEKEASGLAGEAEARALQAHFSHCGSCRSYLARLRAELHELGSTALGALLGGDRIGAKLHALHQLGHWAGGAGDAAQAALERLRHLALRGSAPLSSGDGPAGAVLGTGQKIAAVCGAGAAATATCVLSGAVGPGVGAATHDGHRAHRPPPKVKRLSSQDAAPAPSPEALEVPSTEATPSPGAGSGQSAAEQREAGGASASKPAAAASPSPGGASEQSAAGAAPSEFGIEGGSSGASSGEQASGSGSRPDAAAEAPPTTARPSTSSSGGESPPAAGGRGSAASSGGSVGFQG
jgi:RNA polymerase sigma factor (sigma-70 family)